ncbi:MAG: hypothetical protein HOV94_18615 [Saccharothrix sp.]|nr:hypothetical protein [Saccharothrix sp.]
MTVWRTALALTGLGLLTACATTTTGEGRGTGETTLGTEIRSLDPSGSELTVTGETGGNRPLTITVGTARLDGTPGDQNPWDTIDLFPDRRTRLGCKQFNWAEGTSVPITVVDIASSNRAAVEPGPPPGGPCRPDLPACAHHTFPATPGPGPRCAASITATASGPGAVETAVTFTLRAQCADAAAKPCDDRRVAAARPSPGRPVILEWTHRETVKTVMHPCPEAVWKASPERCGQGTSNPTSPSSPGSGSSSPSKSSPTAPSTPPSR